MLSTHTEYTIQLENPGNLENGDGPQLSNLSYVTIREGHRPILEGEVSIPDTFSFVPEYCTLGNGFIPFSYEQLSDIFPDDTDAILQLLLQTSNQGLSDTYYFTVTAPITIVNSVKHFGRPRVWLGVQRLSPQGNTEYHATFYAIDLELNDGCNRDIVLTLINGLRDAPMIDTINYALLQAN